MLGLKVTVCVLLSTLAVVEVIPDCQVMVHEPWPMPYIFVTRNSSVAINCTGSASNPNVLFWAINLSEDSLDIALHFGRQTTATLNDHGVYELPLIETPGMPTTLRLLINDTARNNGTEIFCSTYAQSSNTLFLIEPTFSFEVVEISEGAINISWSQDSRQVAVSDAVQTFSLTVSHGSSSQVISLNDSFYYFTAPKDASPCEVYNFSVTAKYDFVGATYTGAGCNISGYASVMLPSLPNITRLRTSLEHELIKVSSTFTLTVLFEPASHCELYSVLGYMLEVKGPSSDVLSQSVSPGEENVIHNLTENTIYSFRVLVSTSVGVMSTNKRNLFTTDVQNVTVTPTEAKNTVVVQCNFVKGSNAQGCQVVLVGGFYNITLIININSSSIILNITDPLSFREVFAFDIESDGSIGSLSVPGVILLNNECITCPPTPATVTSTSDNTPLATSYKSLITTVTVSVLGLAIITIFILVIIIVCHKKRCCCQSVNTTSIQMKPNEVYGIVTDHKEIVTTPNEVYGVGLN